MDVSSGRRRLFAELPADESTDHDVLAQLRDLRRDVVFDDNFRVLDERLFDEADGRVEFLELAGDNLLDGLRRLVFDLVFVDF